MTTANRIGDYYLAHDHAVTAARAIDRALDELCLALPTIHTDRQVLLSGHTYEHLERAATCLRHYLAEWHD